MKILVIGQGGREHAMAWKLAQSPLATHVYVAPGNAGTELDDNISNVSIAATDIETLVQFALKNNIALTVVGPEVPLALGIVNQFQQHDLACFGPTEAACQLESSKQFCKDFLKRHHIPSANYECFTDIDPALAYAKQHTLPMVIKADGLAAGKGVIIAETHDAAQAAILSMLAGNQFGEAGHRIIIEQFLVGEEISYMVMSDGKHVLPFASSQDHKRLNDRDLGPNTGGMGAYSPAPLLTPELEQSLLTHVIQPTIDGMAQEGHPFVGFLYAGLIITDTGDYYVLEYNCRLGDPETQALLMRLQSDLASLCQHALTGTLNQSDATWDKRSALTVVIAAKGYPNKAKKGDVIPNPASPSSEQKIFHGGTRLVDNHILTNGGRVLSVTALGDTLNEAQRHAYNLIPAVSWPGCFYRTDIGHRGLAKSEKTT